MIMNGNSKNIIHSSFRRGIFRRISGQIKIWNEKRAAIRHLNTLSDRMLKDIGIERHEIGMVIKRPGPFVKIVPRRAGTPETPETLRKAA